MSVPLDRAAVRAAAGGGGQQELWRRLPGAGSRGAPAGPGLPDVSRRVHLTPETLLQRKPTDHSVACLGGRAIGPRLTPRSYSYCQY